MQNVLILCVGLVLIRYLVSVFPFWVAIGIAYAAGLLLVAIVVLFGRPRNRDAEDPSLTINSP